MNGEREPSFHDQLPAIYRPMNPKVEIIIGAILTSIPAIRAHDAFTQGFNNNGWFLLAASVWFKYFHKHEEFKIVFTRVYKNILIEIKILKSTKILGVLVILFILFIYA